MKAQLLALFLIVNLTGSAWANLGDSEEQLVARYGKEIIKTKDQAKGGAVALDRLSFNESGFQMDVLLFNGISSEESVYHRPYAPMTDGEIKTLLIANAQGQTWKEVAPQQELLLWLKSLKSWQREDGVIASLEGPKEKPRLLFHLKSKELIAAEKAASDAQ
jgi:hypothetical protein